MRLFGCVLSMTTCLIATGAMAGPNLVANGNFATGTFADWTINQDVGHITSNAVVIAFNQKSNYPTGAYNESVPADPLTLGSPEAEAGYGAYFSTDTGTQTLTQSMHLKPGKYSIGFDVYLPQNGFNNPNDASFSGTIAGTTLVSTTDLKRFGSRKWIPVYSTADVSTAGTYDVGFSFTGDGRTAVDVVVDRVFVMAGDPVGVPEPADAAAAVAGVLALGMARLSRR